MSTRALATGLLGSIVALCACRPASPPQAPKSVVEIAEKPQSDTASVAAPESSTGATHSQLDESAVAEKPNPDSVYGDLPPPAPALRSESGDEPWAGRFMQALQLANPDPVPVGELHFKLTICKDGGLQADLVRTTMDDEASAAVLEALAAVEYPAPPPELARVMPGRCGKLAYTFVWANGRVK